MTSVTDLTQTLQTLVSTTADHLATCTGGIRRHRKRSGASLVQTLVLGWLQQPAASLHQRAHMAATRGVSSTAQGLDHRFPAGTATVLEQVLETAVTQVLASDPVAIALLRRLPAVMIQESSLVVLPTPLATTWRGGGSAAPQTAAAARKLHVRRDVVSGALQGPVLQDGRVHDRKAAAQPVELPSGALRLADLGDFGLQTRQQVSQQGA